VTKVDERSVVPRLGEPELRRLAGVLDRENVVAAFVVGSQATGRVGPLSDVDLAVWADPELEPGARFELGLALGAAATRVLGTDEVDLVVLNDAPPLLQHRAMRERLPLVVRDEAARVRLETRALLDYLDTAPLRELAAAALRRRLEEGSFGRR
jgi:predicted nucleotidyltransferase